MKTWNISPVFLHVLAVRPIPETISMFFCVTHCPEETHENALLGMTLMHLLLYIDK